MTPFFGSSGRGGASAEKGSRFIEERSFAALTHLADNSECFDIIFVDRRHLFDFVLTEFTLSAELCSMGRAHYLARHVVAINSASRRIHPREQKRTSNTLKLRWLALPYFRQYQNG